MPGVAQYADDQSAVNLLGLRSESRSLASLAPKPLTLWEPENV